MKRLNLLLSNLRMWENRLFQQLGEVEEEVGEGVGEDEVGVEVLLLLLLQLERVELQEVGDRL